MIILEKYDVQFKKKYGQNFLKDINIVKKIVRVANVEGNSLVIEVGPGGAIMTRELAQVAKNVVAYEIDGELKNELYKRLAETNNVKIFFCDFLLSDLCKDLYNYKYDNLYFVSNVPYYITTPIIMKLIDQRLSFKKIVMMVQKEVGERLTTECGNRMYGALTVILNYHFTIKKEFVVSRREFVPQPNVDSVVVSFQPKENCLYLRDYSTFKKLVYDSFQFKRKTLRNNLKSYNLDKISSVLKEYGYDLNVRAEQLRLEVFVDMANIIYE